MVERQFLWNGEMLNEEGKDKKEIKELGVVQWVSGPWSLCSVTCGGRGQQSRKVS